MPNMPNESAVDVDAFYKHRIENFQIERDVFGKYIAAITPNKGELHVLDWEYRSGIDNAAGAVAEREKATMDLKKITREILNKKQELKAAKSQQEFRIVQIQRLSELSQPVQRDTTYVVKDRFASRASMNLYSGVTITDGHIDLDQVSVSSEDTRDTGSGSGRQHAGKNKRPISASRNVIKSLRNGEVMMLEARLEEETRKLNTGIDELENALKEVKIGTKQLDRVVMQSFDSCREEAAALIKQVDQLDHQGYLSVSELLALRLKITTAQREEIEELFQLHSDKEFFSARESQMREQLLSDMQLMKRRLKIESSNSTKDFHAQAVQLDAQILTLRKKYNLMLDEEYLNRKRGKNGGNGNASDGINDKLIEAAKFANARYNRLRTRHNLEIQGYATESKQLKKKLLLLEKQHERTLQLQEATNTNTNTDANLDANINGNGNAIAIKNANVKISSKTKPKPKK